MTVEEIAKKGILTAIIQIVGTKNGDEQDDLADLEQDILLDLLLNKKEFIEKIDEQQLKYYLTRIVTNNICSTTSKYHYKYRKWKNNLIPIEDLIENE